MIGNAKPESSLPIRPPFCTFSAITDTTAMISEKDWRFWTAMTPDRIGDISNDKERAIHKMMLGTMGNLGP